MSVYPNPYDPNTYPSLLGVAARTLCALRSSASVLYYGQPSLIPGSTILKAKLAGSGYGAVGFKSRDLLLTAAETVTTNIANPGNYKDHIMDTYAYHYFSGDVVVATYDLGSARNVVVFLDGYSGASDGGPYVNVSLDGSTWTTLVSCIGTARVQSCGRASARYVRLCFKSPTVIQYVYCHALEIYDARSLPLSEEVVMTDANTDVVILNPGGVSVDCVAALFDML
jgi:hypothetical protein